MPVEHRADEGGMIAVCRAIERGSARHARLTRPRQISHGALRGHSWADNDDMAGSLFESGARTEALQLVIVAVAGADATGVIALDQSCMVRLPNTRNSSGATGLGDRPRLLSARSRLPRLRAIDRSPTLSLQARPRGFGSFSDRKFVTVRQDVATNHRLRERDLLSDSAVALAGSTGAEFRSRGDEQRQSGKDCAQQSWSAVLASAGIPNCGKDEWWRGVR